MSLYGNFCFLTLSDQTNSEFGVNAIFLVCTELSLTLGSRHITPCLSKYFDATSCPTDRCKAFEVFKDQYFCLPKNEAPDCGM
jgi:aspartate/glutamate racemase